MKKTLAKGLALAVVGTALAVGSAWATPMLYFFANGDEKFVFDNDELDLDPAPGVVTYAGLIDDWSVNVTGNGLPAVGASTFPIINLLKSSLMGTGTIVVALSDMNFGPLPPTTSGFLTEIEGGTLFASDSATYFNAYFDTLNVYRGKGTPIADLGPFSGSDFSGSQASHTIPGDDPFSLTLIAEVTHESGGATVFSARVSPIPEPATMLLLGTGLAGLAGLGRKKMKKA